MSKLRQLRRTAGLAQRECAALLSVPLETFRTWDSGRRPVPGLVLHQAAAAIARHPFSVRCVFGRPVRYATRAAGERFLTTHYRRVGGQQVCPPPLPTVPDHYDACVRQLRRRLGLTQAAFARRVGAAGKAVVYQWESRKRSPSPVLWQHLLELQRRRT